jgi:hypothetical protein
VVPQIPRSLHDAPHTPVGGGQELTDKASGSCIPDCEREYALNDGEMSKLYQAAFDRIRTIPHS